MHGDLIVQSLESRISFSVTGVDMMVDTCHHLELLGLTSRMQKGRKWTLQMPTPSFINLEIVEEDLINVLLTGKKN